MRTLHSWVVLPLLFAAGAVKAQEPAAVPGSDDGSRGFVAMLSPLALQLNGGFTSHAGSGIGIHSDFTRLFGASLELDYHWSRGPTAQWQQVVGNVRTEPIADDMLTLPFVAEAGVRFVPLSGELSAPGKSGGVPAKLVLSLGAGLASGQVQLKPENDAGPGTFGDAGMRGLFSAGAAFELRPLQAFWLRAGLKARFVDSGFSTINGCGVDDLRALDDAVRGGRDPLSVEGTVGAGCDLESFSGETGDGYRRIQDIPLAYNYVRSAEQRDDGLMRQLFFSLGVGYEF